MGGPADEADAGLQPTVASAARWRTRQVAGPCATIHGRAPRGNVVEGPVSDTTPSSLLRGGLGVWGEARGRHKDENNYGPTAIIALGAELL